MTTDIAAITFSCEDPRKVASFWAGALGREVAAQGGSESVAILAWVPLYFRRSEPAPAGTKIHLDLSTENLEAEAQRLAQLGAVEVRRNEWHSTQSITFVDVEGNQFDLIAE